MHQIQQEKQNARQTSVRWAARSSIDERSCRTIAPLVNRWAHSSDAHRLSIDERCDRPMSVLNERRVRSSARRDLGSLFSLSLSFSENDLKWKWGEKIISGSKVKILVNRKSFFEKYHFPWQPNMRVWGKMISWNHFHPKQTHPKWKGGQLLLRAQ